jgi:endoglucanase
MGPKRNCSMMVNRRSLLAALATITAPILFNRLHAQPTPKARNPQPQIPRWRGFNLTELQGGHLQQFQESDFRWMAKWGFNFARLPCSYWLWSSPRSWKTINKANLQPIDRAIDLGGKYGIHINLCLYRIPGYCVGGRESEPFQLFNSPPDSMKRALDAAVFHWRFLAQRYRHVPSTQLSFDLFNEPPFMTDQSRYVEIANSLIAAIRSVSPDRLIFADGADIGQTPVIGLINQGVVQSIHAYLPKMVSHYKATWVPANEFESFAVPTWPMRDSHGREWNRETLRRELLFKWEPLTVRGVPVHVGEWGCYNRTPHAVCLAWMSDLLSLWKEAGWGWALWNLRGSFGIVDSGRSDVNYENFEGHRLDRKMLDLLMAN